jgi:phage N-6-adenine-methyltransferase
MNDEWGTPQKLFDLLDAEFQFDLDACATESNAKCPLYFSKERSMFNRHLTSALTVWMNPPFSKVGEALRWARLQSQEGSTVVCLVPTRTNPPWWHEHVMVASEIRFIIKKVSFVSPDGEPSGVPFTGHAIVVFRPNDHGRIIRSQCQS